MDDRTLLELGLQSACDDSLMIGINVFPTP